ncbi:MAG: peptidoglycan DD-metalloendopeptidase family protein, partial [Sphingomonadales bacterium]
MGTWAATAGPYCPNRSCAETWLHSCEALANPGRRPMYGGKQVHRAPSNTRPVRVMLAIAVLAGAILAPGAAAYASVVPSHTRAAQDAARATYVVRAGDSLSGIVRRSCGPTSGWTATYAASRSVIGGDPNLIKPGQQLTIACATAPQPRTGSASVGSGWVSPLRSYSLTSCYGMRWGALHRGIDMAAAAGTPIRAARAGMVKVAGWHWSGYGIEVIIAHPGGIFTHYAHQSRVA